MDSLYMYLQQQQAAVAAVLRQTQAVEVQYIHIATAASTPYNSCVRVNPTTHSMLQQRQHQHHDKQQAEFSVICINNNMFSLWDGTS